MDIPGLTFLHHSQILKCVPVTENKGGEASILKPIYTKNNGGKVDQVSALLWEPLPWLSCVCHLSQEPHPCLRISLLMQPPPSSPQSEGSRSVIFHLLSNATAQFRVEEWWKGCGEWCSHPTEQMSGFVCNLDNGRGTWLLLKEIISCFWLQGFQNHDRQQTHEAAWDWLRFSNYSLVVLF